MNGNSQEERKAREDGKGAYLHLQLYLREEDSSLFIERMNLINLRNNETSIQCSRIGIVNPFNYEEGYAKG